MRISICGIGKPVGLWNNVTCGCIYGVWVAMIMCIESVGKTSVYECV